MSRPDFFPLGDLLDPRLGWSLANRQSSFNADAHGVPSRFPRVRMNLFDRCLARFVRPVLREPAVAKPCQTTERPIIGAAEPNRYGALDRQRVQPGVGDPVPPAFEGDQLLSPELAHDFNLLLRTAATVFEVFAEGFVFHGVPAD